MWRCCCGFGPLSRWVFQGGEEAGKRSWRAGVFGAFGRDGWQGIALGVVCVLRGAVLGLAANAVGGCEEAQPL